MTSTLSIEWKRDDYVSIAGMIDEKSDFDSLFNKPSEILFIDFKDVSRINSSGVRQWVLAVEKLKEVELHYINCSYVIVDQLSMVPEFLGKKCFVESFDARYVCESCDSVHCFTLVVGYDIEPGLPRYTEGPKRFCPKCKNELEFDHNPDSYLFFLSKIPNKKENKLI